MPGRPSARVVAAITALASCSLALPGCLIRSDRREEYTGRYVSQPTFSQIEPGVTTRQWVLGTLGEPDRKTPCEDGSELWKYSYNRRESSSGAVLFVFGGSTVKETGGSAYVQLKDGVVVKAWRTDG